MTQTVQQRCLPAMLLLWLVAWFVHDVPAQVRVVSDGHPGASSAELEDLLPVTLRSVEPRVAVIFAGANDALNDRKLISAAATAQHLTAMVRMLRATGAASIVLVTVHQPDLRRLMQRHSALAYGDLPPEERLTQVDRVIAEVAAREHVPLARFAERMAQAGGATEQWSTDGVHLTARGYAMLAEVIFRALPQPLPPGSLVLCFGDSLTYGIGVRAPGVPDNVDTYPSQLQALLDHADVPAATETSHSRQR